MRAPREAQRSVARWILSKAFDPSVYGIALFQSVDKFTSRRRQGFSASVKRGEQFFFIGTPAAAANVQI